MYSENIKTMDTAGGLRAAAGGFARGIITAAVFTLVVFALFACILAYTAVSESAIPIISTAVQAAGALIAGFCTAKRSGSRGFLSGLVAGLGYILIIWFIASLAGDGFYVGIHFLSMLGFSALGGAVGGVMGVNLKSGRSNKRKR